MFSKQDARFFSQTTRTLSVVLDAANDLDLGTAFGSAQAAVKQAGDNIFLALYHTWYQKLRDQVADQMGALLTKQITPDEFVARAQAVADGIARDTTVPKYQRT